MCYVGLEKPIFFCTCADLECHYAFVALASILKNKACVLSVLLNIGFLVVFVVSADVTEINSAMMKRATHRPLKNNNT